MADGSTNFVRMAIGKKATMQSLKGKTGWAVAAAAATLELGLLYRSYLR